MTDNFREPGEFGDGARVSPVGRPPGESGAELLPCPFCGAECERGSRKINPWARCPTEGCSGRSMPVIQLDSADSVAAWNRRAPDRALLDRIEELEGRVRDLDKEASDARVIIGRHKTLMAEAARVLDETREQRDRARKALSGEKP